MYHSDIIEYFKLSPYRPEVEEPLTAFGAGLFRFGTILCFEFDEFAEPKALSASDLQGLVKKYGSYAKTSKTIGTSEAFVRQNSKRMIKRPSLRDIH